MSVLGLAILGKNNEPLYLCDTTFALDDVDNNSDTNAESDDLFGFSEKLREQRHSLPLRYQLFVHAALDWLEEEVDLQNGLMPVLISNKQHPHWLGLLYNVDDGGPSVYGYITATNIKFLLLLAKYEKNDENKVKDLLADIHQSYIAYVMNPFSNATGFIESPGFDEKIKVFVRQFEQSKTT